MNIRRFWINLAVIAVITILALTLSYFMIASREDPAVNELGEQVIYVKARPVVYASVTSVIKSTGRLASQHDVDLSSEVQGQILPGTIRLKEGETFKKDDLLIRIYSEEARNNLKALKSRFLNSIAGILPDFKIDFPESFEAWKSFFTSIDIEKPLPDLPGFGSEQEKIYLAGRNILNDYYTIQSSQIRLAKYDIYAPFSGTFTSVYLQTGSIASPGSRIATMIRTDKLELEVPVDVNDIYRIAEGSGAIVKTDDGNHLWNGTVVRIADYLDPKSQSVTVYIELSSSPGNRLYQGQYLTAEFKTQVMENVMEIPRNSLYNKEYVYIIRDGRLEKSPVIIEKINENSVVFSGLDTTVMVVTEPLVNVAEGMPVEILN